MDSVKDKIMSFFRIYSNPKRVKNVYGSGNKPNKLKKEGPSSKGRIVWDNTNLFWVKRRLLQTTTRISW